MIGCHSGHRGLPPYPPADASAGPVPGSCRGWYQADRQPFTASQYTTTWPGPCSRAAEAGPQSHGIQLTVIRPGPHSCPFAHRSG